MSTMKIVLGSTSVHKIDAVKQACAILGGRFADAEVIGVKAKSGVAEQPYTMGEIARGANNRAMDACSFFPEAINIGIESGLDGDGSFCVDLAMVTVFTPDGRAYHATSIGVEIPIQFIQEHRERFIEEPDLTIGDVVKEHLGGDRTDPHATLTGGRIKRLDTLVEAIRTALILTGL